MDILKAQFQNSLNDSTLVKIVFSCKRRKSLEAKRVTMRPFDIGDNRFFQFEYIYETKTMHENLEPSAALDRCMSLVCDVFKEINILNETSDIQILASKPERPKVRTMCSNRKQAHIRHDKIKNYIIPNGRPCDFLIRLGVMSEDGRVYNKHYSKFRQINRFLEIVDDVYKTEFANKNNEGSDPDSAGMPDNCVADDSQTAEPLKIIDFGCGKAYLTFAVYYYLKRLNNRDVDIIGLDLKKEVIDYCNKIAEDLRYSGLRFITGDIADYKSDRADMVITLHACDTATDYALINAVRWNSQAILSVPCCQHELFKQLHNDIDEPILKYGILKDKFTELITDAVRGLKLEANGYKVSMLEFTPLEHTAKNIMIKAVKAFNTTSGRAHKARKQYEVLKRAYRITPTIDKL